MSVVKKIWKRATRRHHSSNALQNDEDGKVASAASSSSSLVALGALPDVAAAAAGHHGAGAAEAEATAQQEAMIAALQSTVLEQRRRIEGMDATVGRLYKEARRQGFHVEALQRLLHQLTCAEQEGDGGAGLLQQEEGDEGKKRHVHRASRLAPTPAPPVWGSSNGSGNAMRYLTAVEGSSTTQATGAQQDEEGSGLYSYISGFLGGAASTLLPSSAGAVEQQQQEQEEGEGKAGAVAESGKAEDGQLVPAAAAAAGVTSSSSVVTWSSVVTFDVQSMGRPRMELEDAQVLLMSQILEQMHLAEDRYHFQAEEIHALQQQVKQREEECLRLRAERTRHALLLHGLKRELAAHRHKVGGGLTYLLSLCDVGPCMHGWMDAWMDDMVSIRSNSPAWHPLATQFHASISLTPHTPFPHTAAGPRREGGQPGGGA